MKGLMKTVIALIVSAGFMTSALYAAEFSMKISMGMGPKKDPHYEHTPLKAFVKEVNKKSNGRIKAKVFWNYTLGKNEKVVGLVRDGLVEAQMTSESHVAPYYPNVQVLGIPYLFVNRQVAYEVLDGPVFQRFNDRMAKEVGIRPLVWFENSGYRHYSSSKRIMRTADDMKGLKMRTMTNPTHMAIARALGMSPTPISWSDLYTALQTGVVDGQENALGTFRIPKLEEVQKYIILDGHVYSILGFWVSEKFYQRLPDDLKQVVVTAANNALKMNRELSQKGFAADRAYLESKGLTIVDPTPATKKEFQRLTQGPAIETLKKEVDADLIEEVMAAVRKAEAKFK